MSLDIAQIENDLKAHVERVKNHFVLFYKSHRKGRKAKDLMNALNTNSEPKGKYQCDIRDTYRYINSIIKYNNIFICHLKDVYTFNSTPLNTETHCNILNRIKTAATEQLLSALENVDPESLSEQIETLIVTLRTLGPNYYLANFKQKIIELEEIIQRNTTRHSLIKKQINSIIDKVEETTNKTRAVLEEELQSSAIHERLTNIANYPTYLKKHIKENRDLEIKALDSLKEDYWIIRWLKRKLGIGVRPIPKNTLDVRLAELSYDRKQVYKHLHNEFQKNSERIEEFYKVLDVIPPYKWPKTWIMDSKDRSQ